MVDRPWTSSAADPRLEQEERAAHMVGIPTISIAGFSGVSVGQGGTPGDDRWLTTPVSTRSLLAKAHDRRWPVTGRGWRKSCSRPVYAVTVLARWWPVSAAWQDSEMKRTPKRICDGATEK